MSVFGISETTTKAMLFSSMCDIEFLHPGVIDIKQLLFASRQHVVAYLVGGSALVDSLPPWQNGNSSPLSSSQGEGGTLEIVVKYGTTLNVRYPPPIVASSAALGGVRHPWQETTTMASSPLSCSSPSCTWPPLALTMQATTSRPDNDWRTRSARMTLATTKRRQR